MAVLPIILMAVAPALKRTNGCCAGNRNGCCAYNEKCCYAFQEWLLCLQQGEWLLRLQSKNGCCAYRYPPPLQRDEGQQLAEIIFLLIRQNHPALNSCLDVVIIGVSGTLPHVCFFSKEFDLQPTIRSAVFFIEGPLTTYQQVLTNLEYKLVLELHSRDWDFCFDRHRLEVHVAQLRFFFYKHVLVCSPRAMFFVMG